MISDLFETDADYESVVVNANLLDFAQNRLYGYICKDKLYIPNNSFIKASTTQPIINFPDSNQAFDQLLAHIRNHCTFGRIPPSSKFHINNLKVTKSFINSEDLYKQYMFLLLAKFVESPSMGSFIVFSEFYKAFTYEMKESLMFMSDFIQTEAVSIFSSGLAYQIFNEELPDLNAAKEYIQDNYFYIFKNICLQYNFIIDKHMPWVIVYRVTENYLENNKTKYIDLYGSDMSIFFQTMKLLYIFYVNNHLNRDLYGYVDIKEYAIPKDSILKLYIQKKLEKRKIDYSDKDFNSLLRFFKYNAIFNGISDSAHKFDNLRQEGNAVYNDRQQIYLRPENL